MKTRWHIDNNGDVMDEQSLLVARPNRREDGPLIAAAPEMREVLEEISRHLYTSQDASRYRAMAQEVIAKLTTPPP